MNTLMAKVWFAVSLLLGTLLIAQSLSSKKQTPGQADAASKPSGQAVIIGEAIARAEAAEKENVRLEAALVSTRQQLARLQAAPTTPIAPATAPAATAPAPSAPEAKSGESKNPMSMLGEMFKNPSMRKVMESQQKAVIDAMYDPLLKELDLAPEDAEDLKKLLLERQMKNVSQVGELMDPAATNRAEIQLELAEANKAREEQIKTFLGGERYQQYQEYSQTLGERTMLNQFSSQTPLEPGQREQLMTIMREEKQASLALQPELGDPNKGMEVLQSQEAMERLFSQQSQVNASVLERSRSLLTPEQHQALEAFQKNQMNMQRMGMEMARKMMQPQPAPTP